MLQSVLSVLWRPTLKPFYEKLEALLDKGQKENVINIYPQNLTEAQIDYLFSRFNAKLGGSMG